jgi:hypothetical protein
MRACYRGDMISAIRVDQSASRLQRIEVQQGEAPVPSWCRDIVALGPRRIALPSIKSPYGEALASAGEALKDGLDSATGNDQASAAITMWGLLTPGLATLQTSGALPGLVFPKQDNTKLLLKSGEKAADIALALYAQGAGSPRLQPSVAEALGLRPEEAILQTIPVALGVATLAYDWKRGDVPRVAAGFQLGWLFLKALALVLQVFGQKPAADIVSVIAVVVKVCNTCRLVYLAHTPGKPFAVMNADVASRLGGAISRPPLLGSPKPVLILPGSSIAVPTRLV